MFKTQRRALRDPVRPRTPTKIWDRLFVNRVDNRTNVLYTARTSVLHGIYRNFYPKNPKFSGWSPSLGSRIAFEIIASHTQSGLVCVSYRRIRQRFPLCDDGARRWKRIDPGRSFDADGFFADSVNGHAFDCRQMLLVTESYGLKVI